MCVPYKGTSENFKSWIGVTERRVNNFGKKRPIFATSRTSYDKSRTVSVKIEIGNQRNPSGPFVDFRIKVYIHEANIMK